MGTYALLVLLAALALTSTACSESLQQTLWNRTNNCSHCDDQLRLILNISEAVVKHHTSAHKTAEADELGQRLSAVCRHDSATELLQRARTALGPLRLFAEKDSILAILGRRIILACIALHGESLQKDVPREEFDSFLAGVAKELYGLHVDAVLRKPLVDYLHISKSGGTSFSQAARYSRCKMAAGIGQPLYIGDMPHWINRTLFYELTGNIHIMWSIYGHLERGEVVGCQQRIANVTAGGLQYLSNEYTLHGGMEGMERVHVCRQAVNVVMLRSPEARLLSHLHFMLAHMKARITRHYRVGRTRGRRNKKEEEGRRKGAVETEGAAEGAGGEGEGEGEDEGRLLFRNTFCTGNTRMWTSLTPAILDNYNVRSFLGERAFHTPYGGIGQQHLEVARRMLLQFDLIMDLDAGEEAADLLMYQGLGWNVTLAEVHARSIEAVATNLKYNRTECGNEGLLEAVLPLQGPDRELYSLGRVLSLLDQLLLSWVQQLGLEPRRPEAAGAGANATTDGPAEEGPPRCGLVGHGHLLSNQARTRPLPPRRDHQHDVQTAITATNPPPPERG